MVFDWSTRFPESTVIDYNYCLVSIAYQLYALPNATLNRSKSICIKEASARLQKLVQYVYKSLSTFYTPFLSTFKCAAMEKHHVNGINLSEGSIYEQSMGFKKEEARI